MARRVAGRSAPPAGRSRARWISSDVQSSLAPHGRTGTRTSTETHRGSAYGRCEQARLDAALERARAQVDAPRHRRRRARGIAPEAGFDGGAGRSGAGGDPGEPKPRRDPRRAEPGASAPRAARARASRGAELADRRPRDPRRPRVVGLERCRSAASHARGGNRRGRGTDASRARGDGLPDSAADAA